MRRAIIFTVLYGWCLAAAAEMTTAEINVQIAAARALYEEAKSGHHAWIATRRLLEDAEAALDEGDRAAAEILAQRAYKTAAASVAQMQREKTAWQKRVPGN